MSFDNLVSLLEQFGVVKLNQNFDLFQFFKRANFNFGI